MAVPVEPVELEKILAQAAETYFPKLTLVYNCKKLVNGKMEFMNQLAQSRNT